MEEARVRAEERSACAPPIPEGIDDPAAGRQEVRPVDSRTVRRDCRCAGLPHVDAGHRQPRPDLTPLGALSDIAGDEKKPGPGIGAGFYVSRRISLPLSADGV